MLIPSSFVRLPHVCLTTLADTSPAPLLIVTRQTGAGKCSEQGKQEKWEQSFTCKKKKKKTQPKRLKFVVFFSPDNYSHEGNDI